ncbi:pyridine nucleotide-disulfide oxidoreductase/dicluster-binding protein [Desulfovibrio sp. JC010]|uniref:pyridine nucleotide-disulfide oxidoreductase/dicluster-binding protein n=1 Tax=Desulfovibrio sp. JC010 TaxID=2593641 RepID=UPI0013D1C4CF|nr:pyridine nucleotide-disulfide oxidoreductase/dicluster-binding protein [Desulfovibrio sp. JC010]NDV25943.1 4Fe-4S ferredoxin [Desulfovibrio sp. JC010]
MDQKNLRDWEARCTQEEPPKCKARCPLHVDGREFCRFLQAGQVDKAWAVLCKTMPFPAVTARICGGDCQNDCLRAQRGGGIELASLERFAAENAKRTPIIRALPPKGRNIAVFGAHLSGLTAAWDLGKKGFTVIVFCENKMQGLGHLPAELVSNEIIEKELAQLGKMNVSFAEHGKPDAQTIMAASKSFDAIFIDPLIFNATQFGLSQVDPATLETSIDFLFASPDVSGKSITELIAVGRKGALSIERKLQNASLTAGRDREAPFETKLFTNISKVATVDPVAVPDGGYSLEQAREEASRCLLCECMECVNNCVYLQEFKSYPKAYARQIYNNASIVMGTRMANTMINSCMLCGLCEQVCPENFAMQDIVLEARQDLVEKGHMPPSAHEFAFRDMDFADSSVCALARHQPGTESSRQFFFPGCQLSASDPGAIERTYAHLCSVLDGGTGLLLRCCGAPADWAGQKDMFGRKMESLKRDWESLGRPQIIAACPSCMESLQKGLPEADVISLWTVLGSELGQLSQHPELELLSLQDPCSARSNHDLMNDVRMLLSGLDITFEEPELSGSQTECCGFGGLLSNANQPLSRKAAEHRAEKLDHDGVTYCAMCRDMLAKAGKRCMHFLDIIFPDGNEDPAGRIAPGYSARRENRVRLKENLLRQTWNEQPEPRHDYESVAVEFTEEARTMMEERRILLSDIQKTLHAVQDSAQVLENTETGHKLIQFRPVTVTYWVEYEMKGGSYLVHRVWSHRMRVLGVGGNS